ncbi:MAG: response regulator [Elusimicrobia bacterium]|nr:response regulator [Elusimicrobiota bacterium]
MTRYKILIVDDEEYLRILLRDNLELEDFEVVAASTGKEAIEMAWKTCPDLAIIDIGLPDMTGWEVCRRLKEDFRSADLPIVILTAETAGKVGAQMKELGITHHIAKPYHPIEIITFLKDLLTKSTKDG